MLASKLTSKYQASVPEKVRKVLGVKKGDRIGFEIKGKVIRLRKVSPLDVEFAKSLEHSLSEWNSDQDEEAYRDL